MIWARAFVYMGLRNTRCAVSQSCPLPRFLGHTTDICASRTELAVYLLSYLLVLYTVGFEALNTISNASFAILCSLALLYIDRKFLFCWLSLTHPTVYRFLSTKTKKKTTPRPVNVKAIQLIIIPQHCREFLRHECESGF